MERNLMVAGFIAFVEFNSDDIVRHRLVKDIVKAYNEEQEEHISVKICLRQIQFFDEQIAQSHVSQCVP